MTHRLLPIAVFRYERQSVPKRLTRTVSVEKVVNAFIISKLDLPSKVACTPVLRKTATMNPSSRMLNNYKSCSKLILYIYQIFNEVRIAWGYNLKKTVTKKLARSIKLPSRNIQRTLHEKYFIERFHLRGQHLCKNVLEQKKAFILEKSSIPIGLVWNPTMAALTSCENAPQKRISKAEKLQQKIT